MSQGQPRRPEPHGQQDPIKYGDVFDVSGDLAKKPIAPQDAAMMQTAETTIFGQTQKGGPAAVMQSAAAQNLRAGVVGHRDVSDVAAGEGVTVTQTDAPGRRIITESIGGQVVGRYEEPTPVAQTESAGRTNQGAITIGEALEASAQTAGDKAVDQSDAAAIQAAEARATGSSAVVPGRVAASAQAAASHNEAVDREEDKIKLNEVLAGASERLAGDKAVTREDAEGVASAEMRNSPNIATHPGGVAASLSAAARLNEDLADARRMRK